MPDIIEPVPGDPSTEPVATAQQSHVNGRVGPPTIPQDASAEAFVPEGVEQVEPGTVLPADYAFEGGAVELAEPGDYAGPDADRDNVKQVERKSAAAAKPSEPKRA